MAKEADFGGLVARKCLPCPGCVAVGGGQTKDYLKHLPGWNLGPDAKCICKTWVMADFSAAVALINQIKDVAEADDHHPDLHLTGFRSLAVELSTHAIGGLSENDFIMAAKIEKLPKDLKKG